MWFNTIAEQEKVDFAKSLSVMLRSGISINDALGSLAEQVKSGSFKKIILKVKNRVEYGTALSDAMAKDVEVFGRVFVYLVKSGEASGSLEDNLVFIADFLEKNNNLRQEIKAAMFYPKFVLGATILMGMALAVYILPKLVPLFGDLKVDLPLSTKVLLAMAVFVQQYWLLAAVLVVGLIVVVKVINKTKRARIIKDYLSLKIPFISPLIVDYNLAIICQILSALLKGGLALSETLDIAAESVSNIYYKESLEKAKRHVGRGTKFGEALKRDKDIYPVNFLSIVLVGESSGNLEESLKYLTEYYSKETEHKTKKLPTIIEPLLLVVIALGVLFLAISIIMPIYSLTRGLGR